MTNWPRGGYPAGDIPASELKPPPDSMISKSSMPATYTAAEVKVLTEAALRLGRKEAGEEVHAALKKRREDAIAAGEAGWPLLTFAMVVTLEISRKPPPDATSGRTDPGMASDLPPEPQAVRSQEDA